MRFKKFDKETITSFHGDMYLYRDLYEYEHAKHSARASELIEKGEIVDQIEYGQDKAKNVKTPYIIFNISRIICDVPAYFVSGAIGEIKSSLQGENVTERSETVEGEENEVEDKQQAVIDQITKNSRLLMKHKSNIVQHQIDGGIVGVPKMIGNNITIEFKERNIYYPHSDGLGCDLIIELDQTDENDNDYVLEHVERQDGNNLVVTKTLYKRDYKESELEEVTDVDEIKEILGEDIELASTFRNRSTPFPVYWGNDETFMNPLGVSALKGQENKQEEINWTLTRSGIVFERNGKPRISVTTEIMDNLKRIAHERYGDEDKIDYRDLGVTEMDEQGNSIMVHQIDITKIGDMTYVKDIIKAMLAETSTSEKAIDLLNDGASSSAQSGVAKFYDLMSSVIKSRQIAKEYTEFLQSLYESALWLAREADTGVQVERPYITFEELIPTPKKENNENTLTKYRDKAQSVEQTVKELHPDKTSEWIDEEVERIQDSKATDDSASLMNARSNLQGMFGNRGENGEPLNDDGTSRLDENGEGDDNATNTPTE